MFGESEAIKSFMKNIIRCGKVSSIDCAKCTARVVFADDNDVVSYDLPVLQRNALDNKDYQMPDIGENVVCVFLPIGGVTDGFIVGSFYPGSVAPPETAGNFRTVVFADGTRVRYDRDKHELTAEIGGTKITANQIDVLVNTPNSVIVTAASNVTINTPAATITAPEITLNGNVQVSGTLTAGKDVVANKVSLVDHKHLGDSGGETSKPLKE